MRRGVPLAVGRRIKPDSIRVLVRLARRVRRFAHWNNFAKAVVANKNHSLRAAARTTSRDEHDRLPPGSCKKANPRRNFGKPGNATFVAFRHIVALRFAVAVIPRPVHFDPAHRRTVFVN